MPSRRIIFAIGALSLASFAAWAVISHMTVTSPQSPNTAQQNYDVLIETLPGAYTNRLQYEHAGEELKIKPAIGDQRPWIDQQYAVFTRVDVPAIPGSVIALQWRKNDAKGAISRQRLWSFRLDDRSIFMDFYSFKTEIDFANPMSFSKLTTDDLITYGPNCALPVYQKDDGYYFSIPETCRIISRSGRDMILSADIIFTDRLSYKEAGRLVDGTPIFEVPGQHAYEFMPLTPK